MKAIAVFNKGSVIEFIQGNPKGFVTVKGVIKGMPNPTGKPHGGLHDAESHAGDLGNVSNGPIHFKTKKFSVKEIIGRALIIHEGEDDLGLSGDPTGHAGKRMECAVIGTTVA
jgi:Cu/Zn superoxide dismutase